MKKLKKVYMIHLEKEMVLKLASCLQHRKQANEVEDVANISVLILIWKSFIKICKLYLFWNAVAVM